MRYFRLIAPAQALGLPRRLRHLAGRAGRSLARHRRRTALALLLLGAACAGGLHLKAEARYHRGLARGYPLAIDRQLSERHGIWPSLPEQLRERIVGPTPRENQVYVLNPYLGTLLREMEDRSPTFRREMEEMRRSGFRVWIGTFEDLGLRRRDRYGGMAQFFGRRTKGQMDGALFIVNVPMLSERFDSIGARPRQIGPDEEEIRHGETLAVIAHEFAHVHAVARSQGKWTGRCADPAPGQADLDACVVQRENTFRTELGLPTVERYGVQQAPTAELGYAYQWARNHIYLILPDTLASSEDSTAAVSAEELGPTRLSLEDRTHTLSLRPFSLEEVKEMVKKREDPKRITVRAAQYGIAFEMNDSTRQELRRLGASRRLLADLSRARPLLLLVAEDSTVAASPESGDSAAASSFSDRKRKAR